MEIVLRINTDTKVASLTTYDEQGKEVERIDHVKEFTLQNLIEDNGVMPSREFMIAGTAITKEGDEVRLQRFMNKEHPRFVDLKTRLGGEVRKHPDDNGNRVNLPFKTEVNTAEIAKPGVLGFMNDVIIRQQPRGR
mgnify:CR=1 FL=1